MSWRSMYFKRANQIQPQRRALSDIATMNYRLGRYEEAVTVYLEALRLDPKSDVTHANLGYVYARLQRRGDAKKDTGLPMS